MGILNDPKGLADPKKYDFFSKQAMLDLEIDKEFGDYVDVDDYGEEADIVADRSSSDNGNELVSLLEKASLKEKAKTKGK